MTSRPARMALTVRSPPTALARVFRAAPGPSPQERRMVLEADAYALAADVMMLRAARGHDVTVAPENIVWLMRGAVVMLGAFGTGPARETTEGNDD